MVINDFKKGFKESMLTFFRGFGFFVLIFSFLFGVFFSSKKSLFFFILVLLSVLLNVFLKKFFEKTMGNKEYPIIGSGIRPHGGSKCPKFGSPDNNDSFGMPSGHTQIFAFVSGLITFYLFKIKDEYRVVKALILLSLSVMAMYVRVYIDNCHTIEQVLIGFIIGKITSFIVNANGYCPF